MCSWVRDDGGLEIGAREEPETMCNSNLSRLGLLGWWMLSSPGLKGSVRGLLDFAQEGRLLVCDSAQCMFKTMSGSKLKQSFFTTVRSNS